LSRIPGTIKRVESISPSLSPQSHLLSPPNGIIIYNAYALADTQCNGYFSIVTPVKRNPALDITFSAFFKDILTITPVLHGEWGVLSLASDPLAIEITLHGARTQGIIVDGLFSLNVTLKPDDDYIYFATSLKLNWVKWSNIGHLNFTVWKDNIAGERPLDWKGAVYSLKKLGNKVVAYGENGVSFLVPVGNTYGLNTVHRIGLKGRHAVSGNNSIQFFVDTKGRLFSLGETPMKSNVFEASSYPQKLDYSEYLSDMSDLVLSWDEENRLLYICDGEKGYVYNPENYSLGAGPATITGVGSQGGILYIASPTLISTPAFEIGTDIYDFGTTKYKTIHEIEFGTNVSGVLQAAIEYRSDFTGDFKQTEWKDVMKKGNVFLTALGREFRFKAKITDYEYIELDYINIKGIIHDH